MKTNHILLIGGPGAGKGTQAAILVTQGYHHLSTGELLRAAKEDPSAEGQRIKDLLATGNLFPDEEMFTLVRKELTKLFSANPQTKILFDGFPRTLPQAVFLDDLLHEFTSSLDAVLYIEVSKNTMFERMLERGKTSGRPEDKDPDTISYRIEVYEEQTTPLLYYYENKIIKVNGENTVEEVSEEILSALSEKALG